MTTPNITVILAVKNGERYIEQSINSILNQSLKPHEILIIDGHSTDNTKQICSQFSEIKFIEQNGSGIPGAYNQGIKLSEGEFVSFISHDDIWKKEKLEKHIYIMNKFPEVRYTISQSSFFLEKGVSIPKNFKIKMLKKPQLVYNMEALVARRSLFKITGYFDTTFITGEDTDWFARTFDLNINREIINEPLILKRIHDKNYSIINDNVTKNMLKAMRKSIRRKRQL